jgi:hypothetical protein
VNSNQEAVASYNARAAALDSRIKDWNERNARANEASSALQNERENWVSSCADRRYREDDELAIKRGQ